jgi:hypothetical protein
MRLKLMLCVSLIAFGVIGTHPAEAAEKSSRQVSAVRNDRHLSETIQACLTEYNIRKRFLKVSVDRRESMKFKVDRNTEIRKGDKIIFLSDLLPGDTLEVTYENHGREKLAKSIKLLASYFVR